MQTAQGTQVLDWSNHEEHSPGLCDPVEVEVKLAALPSPVTQRIDLRNNHLPLSVIPVLITFLREGRAAGAAVCVGSNSFSFEAFHRMLLDANAMDLFETDRLTLGWTEQELSVGRMAARALADDRIVQLTEAIKAQGEAQRFAFERQMELWEKERAARDARRAEREAREEKERAEREAREEKERAEREAREEKERTQELKRARLEERVDSLDGYDKNRNLAIEYHVTDAVDDYMRDVLGFELEDRQQNVRLLNAHGAEVAQLDGLLLYRHAIHKTSVYVLTEAKSNLIPSEYQKAVDTFTALKRAVAAVRQEQATDTTLSIKLRRQAGMLYSLSNRLGRLAIGSPVVPAELLQDGQDAGYLMVHSVDADYVPLNPKQWDRLRSGTATR